MRGTQQHERYHHTTTLTSHFIPLYLTHTTHICHNIHVIHSLFLPSTLILPPIYSCIYICFSFFIISRMSKLEVGLVGKHEEVVAQHHFASSMKSGDVDLFSTPSLVAFAGISLMYIPISLVFLLFLACLVPPLVSCSSLYPLFQSYHLINIIFHLFRRCSS